MDELTSFGTIVLVVAGGLLLALLATKLSGRYPVPEPAIFLLLLASLRAFGVPGSEVSVAEAFAAWAGAWRRFRVAAVPIFSIGVLGTFATAGIMAVFAHYVLDLDWTTAGILGAAVAPTDPAVMFSVLGDKEIAGRTGTILEGESGVNDPVGIALMIGRSSGPPFRTPASTPSGLWQPPGSSTGSRRSSTGPAS